MGKPGAKKMDQIVSVTPGDVHIIMIPSPAGPVPTPLPHPCASMIKDKVKKKVKVMGQPGAVKGSKSKHTPPHIPQGGPFQKPPANAGEIFTGSANVKYEDADAAMLGDTGKMCADPADAPVGKVIGTAALVLVGGGGGGSGEAREKASAAAMKAASAACHKWINENMPPGADREQAHRDLCTNTGHPVDVATGKLTTRRVDLELPGRLPFVFSRNYSSARSDRGAFGVSWRHSYEVQLVVHEDFVSYRDENGRFLEFESIAPGGSSINEASGLELRRERDRYHIRFATGRCYHFGHVGEPEDKATVIPLARISDAFDNRIEFKYRDGLLVQAVDCAGREIGFEYDEERRIIRLSIGAGAETVQSYEYSEDGLLIEARDALDQAYRYEYSSHMLVRETDRNGFSFYFAFDGEGWCRATWGDDGILYRRLQYDRKGQRTREVDSLGRVTTHRWNENGLVESLQDPRGNEWTFDYDDAQRKVAVFDPLANSFKYAYDDFGALAGRTDPEDGELVIERDDAGRRSGYVDGEGNAWPLEYDEEGRLQASVDPLGGRESFEWTARGDLAAVRDPVERVTRYEYDEGGNLANRTNPRGLQSNRKYSARGMLVEESDRHGPRVKLEYDALGQVTGEWRRGRGWTRYELDPEGNIIRTEDPTGAVTRFEYGRVNKLLRRVGPGRDGADAPETLLSYDSENRLTDIRYPGGGTASYGYDEDGHVAWKRRADGRRVRYVRDAAGYVSETYDDDGLVVSFERDGLGRVMSMEYADGTSKSFAYDALGRLVEATNQHGTVGFEYDAAGRIVGETDPHGTATFAYDPAGRLTEAGFGEGMSINYEHTRDQLKVAGHGAAAEISYDDFGRVARLDLSNGTFEEARFDGYRRPRSVTRTAGTTTYDYDDNECMEKIHHAGGVQEVFERDVQGRLVAAARMAGDAQEKVVFGYDAQGNRTPGAATVTYGPGNRLERSGSEEFKYDARGRLTERLDGKGRRTAYVYDQADVLVAVYGPDTTVEFKYDALGRRIAKSVDGAETRFSWEGVRLTHEWRPGGEERHYVYLPDSFAPLICYRRLPFGTWEAFYFQNDHRGCPEALTDADGQVVWQARSGAFGELQEESGDFDQCLGLPGQYRDRETGLVYNHHRYYAPELTTYITPDPIGHLGGEQLYAYTADPITRIDPLGLNPHDYDYSQATPHRIVEIDGVKYVEFDAMDGFTSSSNINVGGSGRGPEGSPDSMASIGPNGEVVVMEGRHRAVAAAAGDPIPENLGGIPDRPGHLRYPLGDNGSCETTEHRGPALLDLAMDPEKLAAARSGHPDNRTT